MSDYEAVFPVEIVTEILTRLPAKSLHRFKCVSKPWLSLITNPKFITHYINTHTNTNTNATSWALLDRVTHLNNNPRSPSPSAFSLSLSSPPTLSHLNISPSFESQGVPSIVISCSDGLVLFSMWGNPELGYKEYFYVCNPVTGRWIGLPKPGVPFDDLVSIGFATRGGEVREDGKVEPNFVIVKYLPQFGKKVGRYLWRFSSEKGEWEALLGTYPLWEINPMWRHEGVFVHEGRMFFVDLSFGLITWDDPFSTSRKTVECGIIPLPSGHIVPWNSKDLVRYRMIGVSGGYVQYMGTWCYGKGEELGLWRLVKCDGVGEWKLLYKLGFVDVRNGVNDIVPCPALLHPFDANVVYFSVGDVIVGVDFCDKKVLGSAPYSKSAGDMSLFLPLVPSVWPVSLPSCLFAMLEKNRGNDFFKKKLFDDAIVCYSKSISHLPTAAAYANRAAAFLKIRKYMAAEDDCTKALEMDEQYPKAYARRAVARKELGKLVKAKEDAEVALKLDPMLQEMNKLSDELKFLFKQESTDGEGPEAESSPQL